MDFISQLSYALSSLLIVFTGANWILKKQFATKADFEILKSQHNVMKLAFEKLDLTLQNLNEAVKDNTKATANLSQFVNLLDKRQSVSEAKKKSK